jgi:ferredoxin
LSAAFRYTTGGRDGLRAGRDLLDVSTMSEPAGRKSVSKLQTSVCRVETARCRSCGACEEACPFSVPRVIVRRGAASFAEIDAGACRGCGVCVAACPVGAIGQPGANRGLPSGRGLLAFACSRSGLFVRGGGRVPDGVTAMELPCAGGVSPAMILGALARGFDGVLVMGRNQETCRLNGAEDHVRSLVPRMAELARRAGLGDGRVRFIDPPKGRGGPVRALEEYRAALPPTPLEARLPAEHPAETLADAVAILAWLGAPLDSSEVRAALFGEWVDPAVMGPGDAMAQLEAALPNRVGAWRTTHLKKVAP